MDIEEKNAYDQYKKPNLSITPYNVKVQKLRYDVILCSAAGTKVNPQNLGEVDFLAVQSGYVEPPPNCRGCIIGCKQFNTSGLQPSHQNAAGAVFAARALGVRLKNASHMNSILLAPTYDAAGLQLPTNPHGISPAGVLCWCPMSNARFPPDAASTWPLLWNPSAAVDAAWRNPGAVPNRDTPLTQYFSYQCNTDPISMGLYCPNILSHYDVELIDEEGRICNNNREDRDDYVLHLVIQYLVDDYNLVR